MYMQYVLIEFSFLDDDMMILQNIFCEPSTTQQDIPTAFFPTTAALPNGEDKNWNDGKHFEKQVDKIEFLDCLAIHCVRCFLSHLWNAYNQLFFLS